MAVLRVNNCGSQKYWRKKKRAINLLGLFMKNSSFFYVCEITRTNNNNVHGFWNVWMKVIQTCGYYQNQIPTQHWMREDHSDSLWSCEHDGIDVSLGCLDKTNMEMQYSKMQVGNKHYTQPKSTTVSRSVASKPEIVFQVHTIETTSTLMYQTTTPLDLELIIPTETPTSNQMG